MSASGVMKRIKKNDKSIKGHLPSAIDLCFHSCCGIHGLAGFSLLQLQLRTRKGIKHGTHGARRRNDKCVIEEQFEDWMEEQEERNE